MKRQNPFTALLRLRTIEEKMRRADMAVARAAHSAAKARLDEMNRRPAAESVPGMLTAGQLGSLRVRGLAAHEQLVAAMVEEDLRRHRLENASDQWRSAAADLDAAERLEDRNRQEAAVHARRAAEQSLADLHLIVNHRPKELP